MADLQGIWTGYDWSQPQADAQVINGLAVGISDDAQRRFKSGQNLLGMVPDYMDKENV